MAVGRVRRIFRDRTQRTSLKKCAKSIPTNPSAIASARVSNGPFTAGIRPEFFWRCGRFSFPAATQRSAEPDCHRSNVTKRDATTRVATDRSDHDSGLQILGGGSGAGGRRADGGNTVVYDRADKVLEIDRHSIMAIAGVPATAWEMARVLEHSLQYFRRTQLQEMSVDGKVRALSKLLRDNFGFVMQGIGVVVPIFATYDGNSKPEARLYFYDAMGAQFEATDYAATGSGSPAVRGILYYENTWGTKRLHQLSEQEA